MTDARRRAAALLEDARERAQALIGEARGIVDAAARERPGRHPGNENVNGR